MKGSADVRLVEQDGVTVVAYEVEAQVGGRMAQLGGPVIDATAKQLAGKFFSRFGECVAPSAPQAAVAAAGGAPAARAATVRAGGFPLVWVLISVIAALTGFLAGRGGGGGPSASPSDWAGIAIGLLLIVVAGGAFEYGRRSATPVAMLDAALLRRLIEEAKK